jgi:hypothetical protein
LVPALLCSLAFANSTSAQTFSNIDGSNNNLFAPDLNAANTPLGRTMSPEYSDTVSHMAGVNRPAPRAISNAVSQQTAGMPNSKGLSDLFWQWGQFLDHDIGLTESAAPSEPAPIQVPAGDPWFDPAFTGAAVISFSRSAYDLNSGTGPGNPRQQMNHITGWIDASNVYGSDALRANALRTNDGTGRLKTGAGDLLPFNVDGLPNAGGTGPGMFLAGDVRANEQIGLTAMHTLFVREHNRLAGIVADRYPSLTPDDVYHEARLMVGALIQAITYDEFLPALLGGNFPLKPYRGYKPNTDARIVNLFSTAVFRFGHTLLSPQLLRLDANGDEAPEGHLALRHAFFSPQQISQHGIDSILRGLASQVCQELDPFVVDDVRNFLFGPPGAGGFDLVALNIQRGRDHGLPTYNQVRLADGLAPAGSFADISANPDIQARLASTYATPDDVDLWVGGLAEDHVGNAIVGPLFQRILKEQFERLRDGDRFWHYRFITEEHLDIIGGMRLSDVIRRNTTIGDEIQDDVFYVN